MKKYILYTFVLLASIGLAQAQDVKSEVSGFAPTKGNFTASLLFGKGNVLTGGLVNTMPAGTNGSWSVPGDAPYAEAHGRNPGNGQRYGQVEAL